MCHHHIDYPPRAVLLRGDEEGACTCSLGSNRSLMRDVAYVTSLRRPAPEDVSDVTRRPSLEALHGTGHKMAPGNKAKTFTGSSLSESQSGTKTKKKKKGKKRAQGEKNTEPEPLRCYSPLVYDPEVNLQELMQKHAKQPESYKISDFQEYETNVTPNGRMGFSNHISRFEIPMDIKQLEDMTVHEYLRTYCWVCKRRQIYYKKFFDKFDKDKDCLLSVMELERALNDIYFNDIDPRLMEELMALTTEGKEVFDTKLFFSICALSERMCYAGRERYKQNLI